MPSVKIKDNEPFDVALRRFKRSCEKAGILAEAKLMKSPQPYVSARLLPLLSVTPKKFSAKIASSSACTKAGTRP